MVENYERDFHRTSWARIVHGCTKNISKNGSKTYWHDITVTPKNILEVKKQKIATVSILILSGDSHNDKLTTNS